MMKVLHIIDSLGRGGAEQVLVTLLPELRQQGLDVALVVRGGRMDLATEFEKQGISVYVLKNRHRWNLIGTARELSKIVVREKVNLLHAHLYFSAISTALMRVLRLQSVPTCVTFHNLAYGGANRPGLKLTFRRLLALGLYRFGIDRFFSVSQAVASHYKRKMSLPRISVIPNPVDLSKVRKITHKGAHAPGRVVLPGRIVSEKGHLDLLEALGELGKTGRVPEVVISGDGPLRAQVEKRARELGLFERIEFTGALSHEEMLHVMAGASIVVVPSRFEGFGLTALESMALGRAVVSSDAGGLPEVVGDAGILFPASDSNALAEAIAELTSNPARRVELGQKAAERARLFDIPAVAAQQIAAYHDLMLCCTKKT
jgi:glycosyltransferase involved in cell wall biosynthesis